MLSQDPKEGPGEPVPTRGLRHFATRMFKLWLTWKPFLSVCGGLITVWQMPTNFEFVRWIIIAAIAGVGFWLAERLLNRHKAINNYAQLAIFQNICWFLLPFYIRSSILAPGHIFTVAILGALAIVWTWDPWFHYLEKFRIVRSGMRSLVLFFAANMALPTVLGLSLRITWWLSSVSVGLFFISTAVKRSRPRLWLRTGLALCVAGVAWFWHSGFPPVPMRVVDTEWSPAVSEKIDALPASLTLHTTILAPQGLSEQLEHRWIFEGELLDRVPLEVTGGRHEGFRTWSRKQNWPTPNAGKWRVEIRTVDGRLLGSTGFTVR